MATMAPTKRTLSAKEAEEQKLRKEQKAADRKVEDEKTRALLQDLRYLALFPSMSNEEEIRSAATRAIHHIRRKRPELVGMEVLEGLDAC